MQQFVAVARTIHAVSEPDDARGHAIDDTTVSTSDDVVRRGPRTDTLETVFTSAFRLLIAEGAHAITANRLHKETGIARTTIYRHWPEPSDLLDAMLERATGDQHLGSFVGQVRTDLTTAVDDLVWRCNERPVRPMFGALVEHGRRDPERGDIAADYIAGILKWIRRAIADGIERGELTGPAEDIETHIDRLVTELSGPLLVEHVLLGRTVTAEDGRAAVETFLLRHGAP